MIVAAVCLAILKPSLAGARSQAIVPFAQGKVCPPSRGDIELRFKWFADGLGAIEKMPGLYYVDYVRPGERRTGHRVAVIKFEETSLAGRAVYVRVKGYRVRFPDRLGEDDAEPLPSIRSDLERVLTGLQTEFPCP